MKRVYFFLATLLGLLSVLPMSGQTITVKAKVPAHWTNTITAWVWETDGDSYDVTPIKEGDWYSYTHTGASFNIIYRNGEDWTDAANQTVDITNIKTNTCFALSQTGAEKAVYTIVDCETGEDITNTDSVFANVLISQSDVELTILNDTLYPWVYDATNACITNSNKGIKYSSATLSLSYKSDYVTEFQVDWLSYNYSAHQPLQLYIDGVLTKTTNSSSYSTPRYYLPAGEHIITFHDSIGNSASNSNYSRIKNLSITKLQPIGTTVLTEESDPLTFTNDETFPWTVEDGYIQSSNYGTSKSSSAFSTTFTIDKPSMLSFESYVHHPDNYTGYGSHYLHFSINGQTYDSYADGTDYVEHKIVFQPGTYTIQWKDTIHNTTTTFKSKIRNIELSRNWLEVNVASPGTLGVEVLRQVNVLNDVELIKIKGTLNDADWTTIGQMNNVVGIDLSETSITTIPNEAFIGLALLTDVKLPETLTSIGEYAFHKTKIWQIDIPAAVTILKQDAFSRTYLMRIGFASNAQLKTIERGAFYYCEHLTEFIMPNTVMELTGILTFATCTNLKKLYFSETLIDIPEETCEYCSNLTNIVLPPALQSIGSNAFYCTTSLRKIDFPETLQSIGSNAFQESRLDTVRLPLNLTTLGNYAFRNCDSLKYVELSAYIPEYYYNFSYSYGINTIVCPSVIPPTINSDPFSGGKSLSEITLYVPSISMLNYKLDEYWYQFGTILPMDQDPLVWTIGNDMTLYNEQALSIEPDVSLTYSRDGSYDVYTGSLTVEGNQTLSMKSFNMALSNTNQYSYYSDNKNYCALINHSNMRADSIWITLDNRNNVWTFITFPYDVKVADIAVLSGGTTHYVIRKYDGEKRANGMSDSTWVLLSNEDELKAGQGYIMQSSRYEDDYSQTSTSFLAPAINNTNKNNIFRNTDVTVALNAYQSEFIHNRGWNLIGNPYPCYYDTRFMDFTAPITVWDMRNKTYNAYSPIDDAYILCPGEAFFVQCPVDKKEIIFDQVGRQIDRSERTISSMPAKLPAAQNAAQRVVINLGLSDGDNMDNTRIVINEHATMQYDINMDASKFMSEDANVPQIYTENNGVNYAINERPIADAKVDLSAQIKVAGSYTITLQKDVEDYTIYLLDKKLNKQVILSENNEYTFQASASDQSQRFQISFAEKTVTDVEQVETATSVENGKIYTIMGQQVEQATTPGFYIQDGKKYIVQ